MYFVQWKVARFLRMERKEEINLEGWNLIEDTPSQKIYQKEDVQKRIQFFENYSVEEHYKSDRLHGYTIGRTKEPFLHYPEGNKSKIYLIEQYENGAQIDTAQEFYEDGSKRISNWKNGQLDGAYILWYGNGQKEKEQHYVQGKWHGQQLEWHKNGQLKSKENYTGGVLDGESLKYLVSGLLKRKKFYQKGKIEGLVYELWDNNGKIVDGGLYSETEYANGIKQGKEMVYYPDGTPMREGYHQKGIVEGERTWWNKNGMISIKEFYKNGKQIEELEERLKNWKKQ